MKLFFDGSKLIAVPPKDAIKNIVITLSGPDIEKFYDQLEEIFKNGNTAVDLTFDFPYLGLGQRQCNKCQKLTNFIVPIPKDRTIDPSKSPQDLKCECGEPFD